MRLYLVETLKETFNCGFLPLYAMLLVCLLGNGFHVLLVKNLKCLRVAKSENLLPEKLDTERMDRAYEIASILTTDKPIYTVAHFLSCLICKCEAEDVARVDSEYVDKVCISIRKDTRLTGASSGDNPDCPFCCPDSFQLSII